MTTNDTTRKQCAERVWPAGAWRPIHCARHATLHEDGKDWCGTHAPSKVAARDAKQRAKWEAERAARDLRWDIEAQERKVLDAAMAMYDDARGVANVIDAVCGLRALYAQRDQPEEGTP